MSVDIEQLSMPDFLALLRYEGNPPAGPEFDAIRMTPQEWQAMFPGSTQPSHPPGTPTQTGGDSNVHDPEPTASPH